MRREARPAPRLAVYCGSSASVAPAYLEAAREVGRALARRGWGLVYGGASVGLMGEVARAALAGGAPVTGVIPAVLVEREIAFRELPDLRTVGTMHERKALMAELADAFLLLPGGYGSLEEFFEALTAGYLGQHDKPCALLNTLGYYDHLLRFLDHAAAEAFVRPIQRAAVLVESDVEALLDRLAALPALRTRGTVPP